MSEYKQYQRKGLSEMRPYIQGEDLTGISVSEPDKNNLHLGGMIARNPKNHDDKWFVAQKYFDANLEPVSPRHITPLQEAERVFIEAYGRYDEDMRHSTEDENAAESLMNSWESMIAAWNHLQQIDADAMMEESK